MNKIDTEKLMSSHNIVDVISKYVPLKKHGKNWFGCCPFHAEKSPSFSVEEGKQFFHCFGCGMHGNVITFVMEYSGLDFIEACKELGAEIELMPAKKVQDNRKLAASINRHLPSYDKRNPNKCRAITANTPICEQYGFYEISSEQWFPVIDFEGEMVNLYSPVNNDFIAGGVSHLAFTPVRKNETNNWLVVVDFWQGIKIANERQLNVLITFSAYNTLMVCNHVDDMNKTPVLRYEDTQAEGLCDKGIWVYSKGDKLHKMDKGVYLDG